MTERKKPVGLSAAEWQIMTIVWDGGPMALGDIYGRLENEIRWAYSTVMSLVRRMVCKGWLEYRRVGNSFLYEPAVARAKAVKSAIREFSDRVLGGLLSPFVAYYAEQDRLRSEDLAQLEEILKAQREKRRA